MTSSTTAVATALALASLSACAYMPDRWPWQKRSETLEPQAAIPAPPPPPLPASPVMAAPAEASPEPSATTYVCGANRLTVEKRDGGAEVSVDGAPAVSLPASPDGASYTDGRLSVFMKDGKTSFAVGRRAAVDCVQG